MKNYIDTQTLSNFTIETQDGSVGSVADFYFDEKLFYLRYLVIDTEPFLLRSLVLVSPLSFHKINPDKSVIDLYITKEELENSPSLDLKQPIRREFEVDFHDYFSYPYYWGSAITPWAIGPYGIPWQYYDQMGRKPKSMPSKAKDTNVSGLRSAKELESFSIKDNEGHDFGHIQGFILNPLSLAIDFVIVDTINYFPSKLVLVRPEWIKGISSEAKTVELPFSKHLIKSAPAYSPSDMGKELISQTDEHFKESLEKQSDSENDFEIEQNRSSLESLPDKELAVGHISSGLFVITVPKTGKEMPESFVASWVQQASFDPLLISIAIKDGRPGLDAVLAKDPFCINILGEDNSDSVNLVKHNPDDLEFKSLDNEKAILKSAKSALVCQAQEISHPGDHYLITAKVTEGVVLKKQEPAMTYQREVGTHY